MPERQHFNKLTDGNYHEWKIYFSALLTKRGLWDVVSGTETLPLGSVNAKPIKSFRAKQREARSEIILNVEPSQLSYCRNEDPAEIWQALETVHNSQGRSTVISLRRRFNRLRLEREETISAYIARVRHLAFLLEEAAVVITDDDLILAITSGLPNSYNPFLVTLDTTPDAEYTLPNVTTRLVNEYQRQHMTARDTTTTTATAKSSPDEALAVDTSRLARITCFGCGNKGHYQTNCPNRSSATTPSPAPAAAHADLVVEDSDESEDEAF